MSKPFYNPQFGSEELLNVDDQILFDVLLNKSVGITVNNTGATVVDGYQYLYAGTPIKLVGATGTVAESKTSLYDRFQTFTKADLTSATDAASCVGILLKTAKIPAGVTTWNVPLLLFGWVKLDAIEAIDAATAAIYTGGTIDDAFYTSSAGQNIWFMRENLNS